MIFSTVCSVSALAFTGTLLFETGLRYFRMFINFSSFFEISDS